MIGCHTIIVVYHWPVGVTGMYTCIAIELPYKVNRPIPTENCDPTSACIMYTT